MAEATVTVETPEEPAIVQNDGVIAVAVAAGEAIANAENAEETAAEAVEAVEELDEDVTWLKNQMQTQSQAILDLTAAVSLIATEQQAMNGKLSEMVNRLTPEPPAEVEAQEAVMEETEDKENAEESQGQQTPKSKKHRMI